MTEIALSAMPRSSRPRPGITLDTRTPSGEEVTVRIGGVQKTSGVVGANQPSRLRRDWRDTGFRNGIGFVYCESMAIEKELKMSKKLYVGSLSYQATEAEVRQLFEQYGKVSSVTIVMDRDTGRAKGFGFVEMDVQAEAEAAIKKLNGSSFGGREIVVNEARPKPDRRPPGQSRY